VDRFVRCVVDARPEPLRPAVTWHETPFHTVVSEVVDAAYSNASRDVGRGAAGQHHDVHFGQRRKGAQCAATERQDLRAPRVVDDARQCPVEIADDEQRPSIEMMGGRLDRSPYRDGRAHSAGEAVSAGSGASEGSSSGTLGRDVGVSAENSGTTSVIAWMKISSGAPP